ncbi:inorganic phosphate transporter [Denitrobacterium detoxificans]|uniref:inorganic phosphate transporter n=1 Tax=Denitrobacterium detoxificans TaxID=79604 RepID=UPI0026EDBAD9|nr:inorganic phosphate transporter [Denitrobacterium detoxificans]MBE6466959.1 inorganic phosphate transporter [Denitrobacterium detoxificans]
MDLSLAAVIGLMATYPALAIIIVLVIGVTLVSGATDAPNAIATAVATRVLSPGVALTLAAVFNFIGLIGMTYISTAVAHTMFSMVDFSGDTHQALMALMASMIGSIAWGVFCWFFGIPCSKSHSLIAGITGGAVAVNGWAGVVPAEWAKVVYGLLFSLFAGFFLGWLNTKLAAKFLSGVDRRKGNRVADILQDIFACMLAFLHGAQDGQKFMSIGLMGMAMAMGMESTGSDGFPIWLMIICSAAISLGTFIGGKRIIKSVAMDMVAMEKYQGAAASASTVITLFISSITGMPVSTSHCSTSAIMGVGAGKNLRGVNWGIARSMVLAWVITFPACGIIGFALARVFMLFF